MNTKRSCDRTRACTQKCKRLTNTVSNSVAQREIVGSGRFRCCWLVQKNRDRKAIVRTVRHETSRCTELSRLQPQPDPVCARTKSPGYLHGKRVRRRSRSRSRTTYFSNISQQKMNNLSQPSFTQHPSARIFGSLLKRTDRQSLGMMAETDENLHRRSRVSQHSKKAHEVV